MCDGTNEIKVLSTFSQAIFMNRFLKQKLNMVNAPTLTLQGEVLTLENIQQTLESDINETIKDFLGGLRSTCTYINAKCIKHIPKCTTFLLVNNQLNRFFVK